MTEIIITLIVALAALFSLAALAFAMHWGYKRENGLVPYVFYFSLLAAVAAAALTPRDFTMASEVAGALAKHPAAVWLQRLSSIFILLSCGERILHRLTARKAMLPLPKLLLAGFLVYFATNIVSPALFGRYESISHEYLYLTIFAVGAMLFNMNEVESTIVSLRNAILLFLLISLAFLAVKPSHVLITGYQGLIPGLHVRYAGLAPHANSLGPMTVVLLLCLWRKPFDNRLVQRLAICFTLLNLFFTQSKTSWICAILSASCIAYYSYAPQIKARISDHRRPLLPVTLIGCAMLAVTGLVVMLMFADTDSAMARLMASKEGADLTSFTGRDLIWRVAIEEWERNPIFGYGLTIWNSAYLASIRMPFAVHAHSQFFQVLSSAGLVGVAGLFFYVGILIYLVYRTARISGGLTPAIFIILLARGVSEVPLTLTGFATESITHLLLIIVLTGYYVPAFRRTLARSAVPILDKKGFA